MNHKQAGWSLRLIRYSTCLALAGFCSACASVRRDYAQAPPAPPAEWMAVEGRWIDLDEAVAAAATEVGWAVTGSDRWNLAVLYTLVSDRGQPGSLLVTGSPEEGPTYAEARLGRFLDAEESAMLVRVVANQLQTLSEQPRLPGAK